MTSPSGAERRRLIAWCLYDFANSAYAAVIIATVFSVYFAQHIVGNAAGRGDQIWGWVVATSMFLVAVSAPVLGAVADRAGVRKRLLFAFTYLCIVCVALFATIRPGMVRNRGREKTTKNAATITQVRGNWPAVTSGTARPSPTADPA